MRSQLKARRVPCQLIKNSKCLYVHLSYSIAAHQMNEMQLLKTFSPFSSSLSANSTPLLPIFSTFQFTIHPSNPFPVALTTRCWLISKIPNLHCCQNDIILFEFKCSVIFWNWLLHAWMTHLMIIISFAKCPCLIFWWQMVDAWGGWSLFQVLLKTLKRIASKHGVSIPTVAVRYILDQVRSIYPVMWVDKLNYNNPIMIWLLCCLEWQPAVAGSMIGVRLGLSDHIQDSNDVFSLVLDEDDVNSITEITQKGKDLLKVIGDCGDEYRRAWDSGLSYFCLLIDLWCSYILCCGQLCSDICKFRSLCITEKFPG